jgi:hypothetical protein
MLPALLSQKGQEALLIQSQQTGLSLRGAMRVRSEAGKLRNSTLRSERAPQSREKMRLPRLSGSQ